ncbi:hypothetical protein Ancab_011708 [Ancistrocladus abbreviatus]
MQEAITNALMMVGNELKGLGQNLKSIAIETQLQESSTKLEAVIAEVDGLTDSEKMLAHYKLCNNPSLMFAFLEKNGGSSEIMAANKTHLANGSSEEKVDAAISGSGFTFSFGNTDYLTREMEPAASPWWANGRVIGSFMECQNRDAVVPTAIWCGGSPLNSSKSLLMIQLSLIFIVTRLVYFSIQPLRRTRRGSAVHLSIVNAVIYTGVLLPLVQHLYDPSRGYKAILQEECSSIQWKL